MGGYGTVWEGKVWYGMVWYLRVAAAYRFPTGGHPCLNHPAPAVTVLFDTQVLFRNLSIRVGRKIGETGLLDRAPPG